jgi:hypothetical protein
MAAAKQLTAATRALLADFDRMLGEVAKQPKGAKATRSAAIVAVPVRPHRYARIEANRSYLATHRSVIITHQSCSNCGRTAEYVSQPLTTYTHRKLQGTVSVPTHHPELPLRLREEFESIPMCASCLRTEAAIETLLGPTTARQLDLFVPAGAAS